MGIQVEQLTKNKTCHQKEFIDFEFNGKHVSEFGMVAVFDGDRHSFNASPSFEDETSIVNGVSGQYYWGMCYKARAKSFTLATDGMTEAQINAFKQHFQPGTYGRFIEDKLANRYAMARVSSEVTFSVVPFKTTITILGQKIEVNEYKGEAKIVFTFDDPFYYATESFISDYENNPELLRALYTNGTPTIKSWNKETPASCWIGEGRVLNKNGLVSEDADIHVNGKLYYYNPSVGKTNTKLTMKFTPSFSDDSFGNSNIIYFNEIADNINSPNNLLKCNTITSRKTGAVKDDSHFYYTSPNVIFQINKSIQIAQNYYIANSANPNAVDFEEQLRLEIVNPKVMAWAASVIRIMNTKPEFFNSETGEYLNGTISMDLSKITGIANKTFTDTVNLNWLQYFNLYMLCMLANCTTDDNGSYHLEHASWNFVPYTIVFDGELSQTTINYSYNRIISTLEKITVSEEKCGDMICSAYLSLEGGDTLDNEGYINSTHELEFKHGDNNTLSSYQASLFYKYTYL